MKLFIVRTGFTPAPLGSSMDYSELYVVAEDSHKAYEAVRRFLDDEEIGFSHDRILKNVELIAEDGRYPEARTLLFLPEATL